MNNVESFFSIHKDSTISFIENKSEFIGHCFYVENKKEAENKILEIKEKYKDATHNCFAYIIGKDRLIQKYSDDKEPQATAGIPILEVLKKKNLTNCLVVVTRYFGGILLGAGGLVRAYTTATILALDSSKIVLKNLFYIVNVTVDYTYLGKIEYILKKLEIEIKSIDYLENANIKLFIKKSEFKKFEKLLIDETSNNCLISIEDELFKSVFINN